MERTWAPVTAPLYALAEGCLLGGVSAFAETLYPGIVIQAVFLTFGTLFALLAAYASRLIQPSENFKLGLAAATGGNFGERGAAKHMERFGAFSLVVTLVWLYIEILHLLMKLQERR